MRLHGLLWLFAVCFIVLVSPLLHGPADYRETFQRELKAAEGAYGTSEVHRIGAWGDSLYQGLFVETGFDPLIHRLFPSTEAPSEAVVVGPWRMPSGLQRYMSNVATYWDGMLGNLRLVCMRSAHALFWIACLAPFLFAVTFDGVMRRKAKLSSFEYTSPTLYNLSWHLVILLVAFSLVLFATTWAIPTFYYPVIVVCCGLLTRILIANIQHSA